MVQSDPIALPYRPIPGALEICIDRHAEAWHVYRRSSEGYKVTAAENVAKARRALNQEIYKILDKLGPERIPLETPLPILPDCLPD